MYFCSYLHDGLLHKAAVWRYGRMALWPLAIGLNAKINAHCASAVYNIIMRIKIRDSIHNNHVGHLSLLLPVRV